MIPMFYHFRAEIVHRPTHCFSFVWRCSGWPSKVRDLQHALNKPIGYILAKQKILRFDVSVDDLILVEADKSINKLADKSAGLRFSELATWFQDFVQFASWGIFQNIVDSLSVVEKPEHPQDIRMFEVRLNLNLSANLRHHRWVQNLFFREHLDRNHIFIPFLPGQIHMAESESHYLVLSLAKRPTDLKPIDIPFWGFEDQFVILDALNWHPVDGHRAIANRVVVADGNGSLGVVVLLAGDHL